MQTANIYLLKDISQITGYSKSTLKFYLKIGVIRETSRSPETRFRYFNDETVERLRQVSELRKAGQTLKEIKDGLK